MIVYIAKNLVNDKIYIGCSVNSLSKRKSGHKYSALKKSSNLLFHKSIRKYGFDNFEWNILWEGENISEMYEKETFFIKHFKTLVPNGYNLIEGNNNTTLGYKYTEDQRKKYKEIRRNMSHPPNLGNKWSDDQKRSASIRNIENHKHLRGDNSPSKRLEVREKIKEKAMGSNNSQAGIFILTSPEGSVIVIHGGIKRELKKYGLSYPSFRKNGTAKGWKLERIDKNV